MRSEPWVCGVVLLIMFGGTFAADQQQCRRAPRRAHANPSVVPLPPNVTLRADLAKVLGRIYNRSPTFRAQCERIAADHRLQVAIHLDTAIPSWCRAFTTVTRHGRSMRADVHLPPGRNLTELVAHEFEHILEQIEGLNLRKLAREKNSGVREVEGRAFETDRAQVIGRLVAAEANTLGLPAAD